MNDSDDGQGGPIKNKPDNDGDESIGQIVPKKSNKRQKAEKRDVKQEVIGEAQAKRALLRNDKLATPLEKGDQKLKEKEKLAFGDAPNQDDSKSLTSNNSLWRMKTDEQQPQDMKQLTVKNQGASISQMFSQVGKGPEGFNAGDPSLIHQGLGGNL